MESKPWVPIEKIERFKKRVQRLQTMLDPLKEAFFQLSHPFVAKDTYHYKAFVFYNGSKVEIMPRYYQEPKIAVNYFSRNFTVAEHNVANMAKFLKKHL